MGLKQHAPFGGPNLPRDHIQKSGLTSAVWPDDHPQLATLHAEIQVLQHQKAVKADGDVLDTKDFFGHDLGLKPHRDHPGTGETVLVCKARTEERRVASHRMTAVNTFGRKTDSRMIGQPMKTRPAPRKPTKTLVFSVN